MARPQTFNEIEVLNTAMGLFWSQGYVATGMAQILETTELKPGSFYNVFSNKRALFIRALKHYIDHIVDARIAEYLDASDPIRAIEEFFQSACEPLPERLGRGCLLTNTATEIGTEDDEINEVVWRGLHKIELAFKRRIIEAKDTHQLPGELKPPPTALHLLSCYQGMCVIGRLTQDREKLRSLAKSALKVLGA